MDRATYLRFGIAVAMLVCGVLARVLQEIMPGLVGSAMKQEEIEDHLFAIQAEGHELHRRLAAIRAEIKQLEWEHQSLDQKTRLLQRQIADASKPIPLFVHEIGEPGPSLRCFRCRVLLERKSGGPWSGAEHHRPDPIWRYGNVAEIWAHDFDQARHLGESSFPTCLGYVTRFETTEKKT